MKNKLIMWLKKYEKYRWVKTGEYIDNWGLFPSYAPIINCKTKVIGQVRARIVRR